MKDRFIAISCNFQGEPGYMVSQIHNGKEVSSGFVPEDVYEKYCEAIGVVPEMQD